MLHQRQTWNSTRHPLAFTSYNALVRDLAEAFLCAVLLIRTLS